MTSIAVDVDEDAADRGADPAEATDSRAWSANVLLVNDRDQPLQESADRSRRLLGLVSMTNT